MIRNLVGESLGNLQEYKDGFTSWNDTWIKQKLPQGDDPFGSLAVCSTQTHDFAPPTRDGFAVSLDVRFLTFL
jgi:hypothetical protein